ncbi:heat shock 70 kDa protein-like, partial [Frankliniella occidentalis]|uniref:Heat shock 70 kDa protein-like n=1 Tax=Frankliniella occidentalis TaxID=133901 RepID=A0A9C6XAQ8_FRAOC
MVLSDLKETAEAALEQKVTKAVVTVPAYFNEKQCQATKDACRIAGLEVLSMINEPTAAAMAYGLEREKGISFAKTVFIFDLGGGTFDVSVMKISGSACQVLASGGDTHLGGQDFDVLLLEHCLEDLKKTLTAGQIETLMEDRQAMQDLRRACELAKRKLSNMPQAQIAVFFPRLSKSYQTTITRAIFEDLCTALFKKTIQVSEQVLADAKVTRAQVHDVVLVGGSTRIPKVRALLRDMFGGKELRQSINPDEAVAHGAAVHAAVLTGDKFVDRTVQLKDEKEPKRTVPETPTASHAAEAIMSQKGVDLRDGPGAAVGIDLGTTYSVVGACRRGKVEIFANDSGSRTTPSIVGFLNDQSFVGDAAKDLPASNQVFDAKRLVGRQWSDQNIQQDRGVWPFEVVEQDGVPRIKVDVGGREETFAPEEISGMVLRDLKETAEGALGQTVSKAVVTVPAYFNERQRQATKDACRIAGLEVLGMINEPTAAAIAYGLDKDKNVGAGQTKTVFIYDLGGGTFDVSVMKISGSDFQVLASGGDTHLGGQDFDVLLLKHCLEDAQRQFNADLSNDKQAVQDLRKACELAKRKLSNMPQAQVSVFLPRLNKGFQTTISRAFFEDLCAELFRKTIQVSEEVLADAKVTRAEVNDVVLVGGSTRIPKVRALLRDM